MINDSDIVVFTNGCFDMFHRGHLELLRFAKSKGDTLLVGVNSDESVKRLKGPTRPIISSIDRAAILRNIRFVDGVYIFSADTPEELIRHLRPDIIVKGPDYADVPIESIVGYNIVKKIVIAPRLVDDSTTKIIERLNR